MPVITIIAFSSDVFHITLIRIACFWAQLSHRSKIGVSHSCSVEISCLQQKSGFCTLSWFVNAVRVFQIYYPPLHTDMEMGSISISHFNDFMSLNPSLGDGVCMHTGKPAYSHPCNPWLLHLIVTGACDVYWLSKKNVTTLACIVIILLPIYY